MKNIIFLLTFFIILSCSSENKDNNIIEPTDCPQILFSSEHRKYIDSDSQEINLQNLSFTAEINNYRIDTCYMNNNLFKIPIEVLVIVNPLNLNSSELNIPLYFALIDMEDELIEMQYFLMKDNVSKEENSDSFIETEFYETFNIISSKDKSIDKIIIGFILDKEKNNILN